MNAADRENPRLRPVEAIPDPGNGRVILRDPTQVAAGMIVVGMRELGLLALLDGRPRRDVQAEYARRSGRLLLSEELDAILEQLDGAGFLAGDGFERHYARLAAEYAGAPFRPLRDPDGFGAPAAELPAYLEAAVREQPPAAPRRGRLLGLVAPHLDYPRGRSCYGAAYAAARAAEVRPARVVVLGTNHFGRSRSVVATGKDFQTPWGTLRADREFLGRLQADCGGDLMPYELDHLREHSIELHAVWIHHLFGGGARLVAVLCPDPSGPGGTAAGDPGGVDLREFALALGEAVRSDPEPTLLVASADLSHVGRYFGDEIPLDEPFLDAVREADEQGLAHLERGDPEAYREHMEQTGNVTRVCSVGCLYALFTALGPDAGPCRLRYHQAVTREMENAVTCAAFALYD